jgi:hypothetical protein
VALVALIVMMLPDGLPALPAQPTPEPPGATASPIPPSTTPTPTNTPESCGAGAVLVSTTHFATFCRGDGVFASTTPTPTPGGINAWQHPDTLSARDGVYATSTMPFPSAYATNLYCTYGFDVPSSASSIQGIRFTLDAASSDHCWNEGNYVGGGIRLVTHGPVVQGAVAPQPNPWDASTTTQLPTSPTDVTYDKGLWGGFCTTRATDCGPRTWVPSDINDADFGSLFSAWVGCTFGTAHAQIDAVSMTVDYCIGLTPTPTMRPPTTPTPTNTSPVLSTPTQPPQGCAGDCDNDDHVTIDELLTLVNIALSHAQPSVCPHGIPIGAEVDIALIIQAVNHALNRCGVG